MEHFHYTICCRSCGYVFLIKDAEGRVLEESDPYDNSRIAESAASFIIRSRQWDLANPDRQPPIGDSDIRGGVPILQEKARHRAWLGNRESADAS